MRDQIKNMQAIIDETRKILAQPDNCFDWSGWDDVDDAYKELDAILGDFPKDPKGAFGLSFMFAPTGPIQEVSVSSGWGDEFLELADRFDKALQDLAKALKEQELGES